MHAIVNEIAKDAIKILDNLAASRGKEATQPQVRRIENREIMAQVENESKKPIR